MGEIDCWKTVIKEYKLEGNIVIFKWRAYDSVMTFFTPNKLEGLDSRITAQCNVMKDRAVLSFEVLEEAYLIETKTFTGTGG